jgi:cytidine deaminase
VKSFACFFLGLTLIACQPTENAKEAEIENTFRVFTGGEKLRVMVNKDYASARGVWHIEGDDKVADPINIHNIWCDLSEQYCEDNYAILSSLVSEAILTADREIYEVRFVDENKVVAVSAGECRETQMEISKPDQSVTFITRQIKKCDNVIGELKAPRFARLISGHELDRIRGL